MASQVTLKALGLNYSPNNLALPEGSLVIANDVIVRRDNVVESRRGFNEYSETYGNELLDRSSQLISYKDRILNHYYNSDLGAYILQYDTATKDSAGKAIFNNFYGHYAEVENGLRIKSIESNKNLYFTTDQGIKKISARTASDFTTDANFIKDAGGVKAIDFNAELLVTQGQQTGFLGVDSAVAYRVLWGYKDLNDNLILGSPSDSISIYNYLTNICALDINALCSVLDKLKQNSATYHSVIHNQTTNANSDTFNNTFLDAFYTNISDTAEIKRTNLVNIANNIDKFSLLADTNPVTLIKPLTITTYDITNNVATISFSIASDATKVFSVGDVIEIIGATGGSDVSAFNNSTTHPHWTIADVTATSIKFNLTAATVNAAATGGYIYPYSYRNIVNNTQVDVTSGKFTDLPQSLVALSIGTSTSSYDANLVFATIYSNVYAIINRLKSELTNFISLELQKLYVSNLYVTEAADVKLTINIPPSIQYSKDYFVQVYRTANAIASYEQVLGVDIAPDDEMNLVYEAFPTTYEYDNLSMIVVDTYPTDLRAANTPLYTNPTSGEGINQSNDIPPIAKDINRFKDTVFYANTKTKHKLVPFTLLGTSNINGGDKILISDGTTIGTNEYTFILGEVEKGLFKFDNSTTYSDVQNKYFILNSANNERRYYVWYRVDNTGINTDINIYKFTVSGTYAISAGDTFTNNGETFTIISSSLNQIIASGTGDPVSSGNLIGAITISFTQSELYAYKQIIDILSSTYSLETLVDTTANIVKCLSLDFTASKQYFFQIAVPFSVKIGDIFTNNGNTYTVVSFINSTYISAIGTGTPSSSGSLVGDTTIPFTHSYFAFEVDNVNEGITDNYSTGNISKLSFQLLQNGDGENAAQKQILLSQVDSRAQAIDITARSLVSVINKNSSSPISAYYVSSTTSLPGIINLESKTLIDVPFYVMGDNIGVGSSFNPDISPTNSPDQANTAYIKIIANGVGTTILTTNIAHGLVSNDKIIIGNSGTATINGIYSVTVTSPTTFTIPTISLTTGNLTASWSKLADTNVSTNETKPNRIYYSKTLQPEAVPILNYFDVGSADKQILRIFPLRDSLFVFKEDGLYRISGETAPFVRTLFDSSCVLIAADSVAVANNIIYGWTNKGISNITEAGVNEISRPIDTVILKLASASYANFSKLTWGLGYDSDNSYTVYTNSIPDDQYPTIAFRYSNLTNTWTNIIRSQTCGVVNLKDDKIYSGSGDYNLINQERKNFDRTDYSDRDYTINVTNNSILNNGSVLRISDIDGIYIGDVITQNQILTIYDYNLLLAKLDFDPALNDTYETIKITTGTNLLTSVFALAKLLDLDTNLTEHDYYDTVKNDTDATIAYNKIINKLNLSNSGTGFKDYLLATESHLFESVVVNVNKTLNTITLNLPLQFVVGNMQVYKAIPCSIQYAPVTFGDPLQLKQIYEATLMFNNKAFTKATASYSSDLKPEFFDIDFYGQGNGIFGHYSNPGFGFGFFGGQSNSAPFRTIIPREAQRCRFINVQYKHSVARELWALYGITLSGNVAESTRAYR